MRVFSLKSCDTCRKALREMAAAGLSPEVVDVRADGIAPADLAEMVAALGDGLVNRRSTTWRTLSEAERARSPEDLLARHPTLMKRPVIETGGSYHMGWSPAVRAAVLG